MSKILGMTEKQWYTVIGTYPAVTKPSQLMMLRYRYINDFGSDPPETEIIDRGRLDSLISGLNGLFTQKN